MEKEDEGRPRSNQLQQLAVGHDTQQRYYGEEPLFGSAWDLGASWQGLHVCAVFHVKSLFAFLPASSVHPVSVPIHYPTSDQRDTPFCGHRP